MYLTELENQNNKSKYCASRVTPTSLASFNNDFFLNLKSLHGEIFDLRVKT